MKIIFILPLLLLLTGCLDGEDRDLCAGIKCDFPFNLCNPQTGTCDAYDLIQCTPGTKICGMESDNNQIMVCGVDQTFKRAQDGNCTKNAETCITNKIDAKCIHLWGHIMDNQAPLYTQFKERCEKDYTLKFITKTINDETGGVCSKERSYCDSQNRDETACYPSQCHINGDQPFDDDCYYWFGPDFQCNIHSGACEQIDGTKK